MSTRTQSKSNGKKEEKSKPVWFRRYWTGSGVLEVSVWSRTIESQGGDREVFNTSLKKTYKDGDDYKESGSYRPEELPLIAFALQEAFSFISNEQNRE